MEKPVDVAMERTLIDLAKRLLAQEADEELILVLTGLTEEQLEMVKNGQV